MNPLEFSWTEDQQVTVINPTSETYKFKVHSKEYEVGAGKTVKMPGYIAWVYVYGLSSQMCQAAGEFNRWNEEEFRKEYFEKLVKNTDPIVEEVIEEEPNPIEEVGEEGDDVESEPAGAAKLGRPKTKDLQPK